MTNMVNMTIRKDGKRVPNSLRVKRLVVMLTVDETQAIEDHRFTHRIGTLSETVRQLVRKSLETKMPASAGK